MRTAAIVLAAGSGTRMGSDIPKQFMELKGHPILYYTLKAFQESPVVDEITLVIGGGDRDIYEDIIEKYGVSKVAHIVQGGRRRVDSVYNGLLSLEDVDYVLIQDSARVFLKEDLIEATLEAAKECGACLAAAPARDTMKLSPDGEYVSGSPDRSSIWTAQTPQTFRYDLIMSCFRKYMEEEGQGTVSAVSVTDDVSLVSLYSDAKVKLVSASYWNMKITEPEDIRVAEALMGDSFS